MNLDTLKRAEADFLNTYPGGFNHPEMQAMGRKHKMQQSVEFAQQAFAADAFHSPQAVVQDMVRAVSRSSMVSMFEKPRFRDAAQSLDAGATERLSGALADLLHGDQAAGFERMVSLLLDHKVAKWPVLTIIPLYVHPQDEVLVKPTNCKNAIAHFELQGLAYRPRPSWDFYRRYREAILEMKTHCDPAVAPDNAAFGGFLMFATRG